MLQLNHIEIKADYAKEWNTYYKDFVMLTNDGVLVSNSLYRVSGYGLPKFGKDKYFLLLKYVEAYYSKDILEMSKSNKAKHLQGLWCILDESGKEVVVFKDNYKSPYLIKGSCVYSIDNNYYNIKTGEIYCYSTSSFCSDNFIFLNNDYDKDESKRGVMKINKHDGSYELFQ